MKWHSIGTQIDRFKICHIGLDLRIILTITTIRVNKTPSNDGNMKISFFIFIHNVAKEFLKEFFKFCCLL